MNFLFQKKTLTLALARYPNGRPAIVVLDPRGLPYATLTVDIPNEYLGHDEMFVKDCDENKDIAPGILRLGIFQATRMSVRADSMTVPIWRIADKKAFESIPDIDDAVRSISRARRQTRK